jgi:hypothetical protein
MSLIPSESLNFPDAFREAVGWRLPKKRDRRSPVRAREIVVHKRPTTRSSAQQNAYKKPSAPVLTPTISVVPNEKLSVGSAAAKELERTFETAGEATESLEIRGETAIAEPNQEAPVVEASDVTAAVDPPQPELQLPSNGHYPAPEPVSHQETPPTPETPKQSAPVETVPSEAAPKPMVMEGSTAHALFVQALMARAVPIEISPIEAGPTQSPPPEPRASLPDPASAAPFSPSAPLPQAAPVISDTAELQEIAQPELAFEKPVTAPPPAPPKTPARIPITPRKWKPRVPIQAAPVALSPAPDFTDPIFSEPPPQLDPRVNADGEEAARKPARVAPKALREELVVVPRPGNGPRKIAVPRAELAHPELHLFTANERRNRWIRFSLLQSLSLICLVALARLAIWHHFVDPTLKILVLILLLATLAAAVMVPMAFMRNSPDRWQTRL